MTGHQAPTGFLGVAWGDDITTAAGRLGLTLERWQPWADPAFETSLDLDHPRTVLGVEGVVVLARAGHTLEGVQVIFRGCADGEARGRTLRDELGRELHVASPDVDVPYQVWADHSLVHLATDRRDGTCTLTVAGPRFGRAFEAALVRGGLGDLGGATRPH